MYNMQEVKQIRLSELQMKALKVLLDGEHTSVGFGWGAGWGKTYLWTIRLWLMCVKYPWVRYAMVRDTIKNVKATTVKSMMKFFSDYNISEEYRGILNPTNSLIKFKNGSEIVLVEWCYYPSDPLYNRFWSLELTGAFIEESAECPIEWIEIIQTRVWRQKNEEYNILWKVLETFNPNPWHVYERYFLWKHKDQDKSIFIKALVNDNPFIWEQYIANLERANEQTKKRLLYGEWDFSDNVRALFKVSEIHDLKTNQREWDKYCLICDVARYWKDTARISVRKGNTWIRVETYAKSSTEDLKEAITYLVRQYGIDWSDVVIDADGVGWWVVDGLPYCRAFINNSKPVPIASKQNYHNLKSQCAFYLQEKVQKKEIAIRWEHLDREKDRETLEQEMMNLYIDPKSIDSKTRIESKDMMKERIGRSPDLLDTLIMRMYLYLLGEEDTKQRIYSQER